MQRLEKGELSLEESLKLYEEGIRLSRLCHGKLEEAEGKIETLLKDARGDLVQDADGNPRTRPLRAPGRRTTTTAPSRGARTARRRPSRRPSMSAGSS